MQLTYLLSFALALIFVVAAPTPANVTWSDYYGNPSNSVYGIACGTTYLDQGIKTLGKIPGWPYVGAAPAVTGSGDPDCGSCWKVTYTHSHAQPKSLFITAIDNGQGKFILSEAVMNELTFNQAWRGTLPITYESAAISSCHT